MFWSVMPWALLICSGLILTACAASTQSGLPVTVSEYCMLNADRLPVLLSRKDTPETVRQVAVLNETYERNCVNGKKALPQN